MALSPRLVGDAEHDPHARRSIRLHGYDYSTDGAYFVTVCVQDRSCLSGEIEGGLARLNEAGRMVETVWQALPSRFPTLALDQFIAMPNHVHGIIVLTGAPGRRGESCIRPFQEEGEHKVRPYASVQAKLREPRPERTTAGSVGRIVQAFKSITTHEYTHGVKQRGWTPFPGRLWQRNYYEHVIRNEQDLHDTRAYILNNPTSWAQDDENPTRVIPPRT